MVAAVIVGWLVDRIGVFPMATVTLALYSGIALSGYFMIHDQTSFLWVYALHVVFSGAYMTAFSTLFLRLFPQMKFTQFASALGIVAVPTTIFFNAFMAEFLRFTNNNYRATLLIVFVCSAIGLGLLLVVWRNFRNRPETVTIHADKIPH
jgi:MFS family permease